jgi:hypothetical protein
MEEERQFFSDELAKQEKTEFAAKALEDYQTSLKKKLDDRYKNIQSTLLKESNIIIRYELKIQLEELMTIYQLLFKE